jgi:pilus assembly protein FimV
LIAKSHRWQKTAVAAAAMALLGLTTPTAMALSLGRVTVLSSLGEPLRAEIDVPDINAEEVATLRTSVAAPDAFVAAGLEYNPAMSGLRTSLQRRPDGRVFIRLTSDRTITDPFVDMIIEASWSSGRIVRDYTMLFDPPVLKKPAPVPTLPQIAAATAAPAPAPTLPSKPAEPVTTATPASAATPSTAISKPTNTVKPAKPAAPPTDTDGKTLTVKDGDTASKIAASIKPEGVSLDQMLVALLRANPDAFIKENINRIRAGAVMTAPGAAQALSVPQAEASQIVVAHSKDFGEFRRSLAANAPTVAVSSPTRQAGGTVEAKVEDKKTAAPTPDKLTLSKGSIQSQATNEKIAKERTEKEAATRATEIAKNISDLKVLSAVSAPTPAIAAAPAVPASEPKPSLVPPVPVAAIPVAPVAPAVEATASQPSPAMDSPAAAASEPMPAASAAVAPQDAPAVVHFEETSVFEDLLATPEFLMGLSGLLAAAAGGFAVWRFRKRKKSDVNMDSSFLESRLQPDSFFGGSGGQRIDTGNEGAATGSSMVYSPSQLDAADDVDPVAEADVYLAYGRDVQAEEILKEAAKTNPGRLAIHTKLLEIYSKRRDARNFEATAGQAFKITGNSAPEWTRICEQGLGIDPTNPLYQPGGSPSSTGSLASSDSPGSSSFDQTLVQSAHPQLQESASVDLDLDLDFSLDEEPAKVIDELRPNKPSSPIPEQTVSIPAVDLNAPLEMDFDLPIDASPAASASAQEPVGLPDISMSMDGLNLSLDEPPVANDFMPATPAAPVEEPSLGMLEFDMGSLSLDLDTPTEVPIDAQESMQHQDPLETKLALAEEFVSIGDEDGARALIEEVVAESTGEMRAKAERALANLS